jgi:hemerythrin-like domain-containing protein
MEATDILMSEHRVIERVIDSLEKAAARLEAGQEVAPEFFLQASDFIKGFADGCHHRKEEGVLFKRMEQHGLSPTRGPVAVMLSEHEQGRQYTREMRQAAAALQSGDTTAKRHIIQAALGYAALLRQHIQKEDHVLFPMANQVIPAGEYDQVLEDFEHVEHEETGEGIHEKYLGIADQLEKAMANSD